MAKTISGFLLVLIFLAAFFAPLLAPYSYEVQNVDAVLFRPSGSHLFGTDNLGRDVFSRVLYGGQVSLFIAIVTSVIAIAVGTGVGILSARSSAFVDRLWLKSFDIFQSIPTLVLMILLALVIDSLDWLENEKTKSILGIMAALSLVGWVSVARVVRAQVKQIQNQDFITAAECVGMGSFQLIRSHLLPNLWGSLLVLFSFQVPSHILQESFLSFLGLGLQPPYSSWGVLIHEGWRSFQTYPHLILGPGAVLFVTIYSFTQVSDWLADRLNPKLRQL